MTNLRKSVHVALPHHKYDVVIGGSLLADAGALIKPFLKRDFVAIVSDENVAALHMATLTGALTSAGIKSVVINVPAGEPSKSWPVLEDVVESLLAAKVERDDMVIAFGGGVVGDLVGFAAAILRRGVRFVQIPTSLLAQVDSSVGGKTGINSKSGKNLIGAFHQPELVLADIDALSTLERREYLAGYGEVAKYGLLGDADFFERLEGAIGAMKALDADLLIEVIAHCVGMKADIVMRDEKERGDRALLNLGHTFGHALEKVTGYSDRLLHGEGVAIGCGLAFDLSARLGLCSDNMAARVRTHFSEMGMRADLNEIDDLAPTDDILEAMYQDKKVTDGKLNFVLVRGIGEAFVEKGVDPKIVRQLIEDRRQ